MSFIIVNEYKKKISGSQLTIFLAVLIFVFVGQPKPENRNKDDHFYDDQNDPTIMVVVMNIIVDSPKQKERKYDVRLGDDRNCLYRPSGGREDDHRRRSIYTKGQTQ